MNFKILIGVGISILVTNEAIPLTKGKDTKEKCEILCKKFGRKYAFESNSSICRCAVDIINEKDVELLKNNAKKMGINMKIVFTPRQKKINKRETENSEPKVITQSEQVVGQVGPRPTPRRNLPTPPRPISPRAAHQIMANIRQRINTMNNHKSRGGRVNAADVDAIRQHLRQLGQSVVVPSPEDRARAMVDRNHKISRMRQREQLRLQRLQQLRVQRARNRALTNRSRPGGVVGAAISDISATEVQNGAIELSPSTVFPIITQPKELIEE